MDHIKIDRSFIDVLGRSDRESALTESVLRIAQQLELVSVAEGIETAEQMRRLRSLGCRLGQGFLFSRPTDFDGIESYLVSLRGEPRKRLAAQSRPAGFAQGEPSPA